MTAGSTKETGMSKGQRGNKEAKKPKKVQSAIKPQSPTEPTPPVPSGAADRFKKKWEKYVLQLNEEFRLQ